MFNLCVICPSEIFVKLAFRQSVNNLFYSVIVLCENEYFLIILSIKYAFVFLLLFRVMVFMIIMYILEYVEAHFCYQIKQHYSIEVMFCNF